METVRGKITNKKNSMQASQTVGETRRLIFFYGFISLNSRRKYAVNFINWITIPQSSDDMEEFIRLLTSTFWAILFHTSS